MKTTALKEALRDFRSDFGGELFLEDTIRKLYATDASAYQEMPLAVAIPRSEEDIKKLILFAGKNGSSLIPRTAGTSLAGQVVGSGIVVDVSRHFTRILEINKEEGWVRVQPGVIRNELNMALVELGMFFAPETSTQDRAMMGGMLGNNSCGSNSVVYGSTRDHTIEVSGFLSDGSKVRFCPLSSEEFNRKCAGPDDLLETGLYRDIKSMLSDPENRNSIEREFPRKSIQRRNTGYALDLLMENSAFGVNEEPFNFCRLIAGSEGTLFFATEIKLKCVPLPPPAGCLLCAHFETVDEALRANLVALRFAPHASELIDHYVLECTKKNIAQNRNRFFVKGDPGAILVVEIRRNSDEEIDEVIESLIEALQKAGLGYHFPALKGDQMAKIWTLRKAGLGLLSNIPGDAKPVAVIEDTAVDVVDLPAYIRDFNVLLKKRGLNCVHYAHAGSGEIHLRPIIDLKTEEGNRLFREVARDIAGLVKSYGGSLSGEHGDGRLRGEFLKEMIGELNYSLVERTKRAWDPQNIFNPGKIVDTPPMNTNLRYEPGQVTPEIKTYFNFDQTRGILRAAEMCNGSGDCRKTHLSGGTMCPSYMATREEKDTTRARANILRHILTGTKTENPFDSNEIKEVMDLCLSCKGCKSECPSNVDMAKLKGEFLQHYHDANGVPLRTRLIGNFTLSSAIASFVPWAWNFIFSQPMISRLAKKSVGFASARSIPLLHGTTLKGWFQRRQAEKAHKGRNGSKDNGKARLVYLFCDEFTNYNDVPVGQAAVRLLEGLGYRIEIPRHVESARACMSKGLLRKAARRAMENVRLLKDLVSNETPLIGIEPSAILSFRDEYPDLVPVEWREEARRLAENCLTIDEFLGREMERGVITADRFTKTGKLIKLHGHCQQKAVSSIDHTVKALSLPENYRVETIPSGCCGMAGSFGYEKEHYELSMKIGELVLFPAVRALSTEVIVAAPGTSCRHQIKDGTGRIAQHPVEVLYDALL